MSEASPVTDDVLQAGAVECLQALGHAFVPLVPRLSAVLRRFILSPLPLLEQAADLEPAFLLSAAVRAYASLLKLAGDDAVRQSAIQSLFNHFNAPSPDQGEPGVTQMVSVNIAHAVAILARESGQEATANLVASMLLQSLRVRDEAIDGAILYELSTLAADVDRLTFLDIVKAIGEAGKARGLSETGGHAVSLERKNGRDQEGC